MRTVLSSHSEVAHFWANKTQDRGRSGSVFFEGDSIYSYGLHFEIARHIPEKDVILFTNEDYYISNFKSSSTGKHKSIVSNSCNHIKTFIVPSFQDHNFNVNFFLQEIEEKKEKLFRQRKCINYSIQYLHRLLSDFKDYLHIFRNEINDKHYKLGHSFLNKGLFTVEDIRKLYKKLQKEKERIREYAEKERIKQEKLKIENADKILKWREGGIKTESLFSFSPVLRVKGKYIESSWGSKVFISIARAVYKCIKKGLLPEKLEGYDIISIDKDILKIGCHSIEWTEINDIAKQLNWG